MKLETKRLIIRRFQESDWEDLYEYLKLPEVVKYEPYDVYTKDECQKAALERANADNSCFWAVCLKENGKMIGQVYFSKNQPDDFETWSIGYVFNPAYSGKGYATEACKRIIDNAFEIWNAHRVVAYCNVKNERSWKLLERLKMRRESHMLQNVFFKYSSDGSPIWNDSYQYAILSSEWK